MTIKNRNPHLDSNIARIPPTVGITFAPSAGPITFVLDFLKLPSNVYVDSVEVTFSIASTVPSFISNCSSPLS